MSNEIEKRIKEDWFKDHVAEYEKLNDRVSILEWGKPGTNLYRVRYVFDGYMLFISGDLGEAVFRLTWNGAPGSFKDVNLGYFFGKLVAHHGDKYDFDSTEAVKELKEWKERYLNDYGCTGDDVEIFDELIHLTSECNSMKDWEFKLPYTGLYDKLSELDQDCCEWVFGVGKSIPVRIRGYLIGLKIALKQLEIQENELVRGDE